MVIILEKEAAITLQLSKQSKRRAEPGRLALEVSPKWAEANLVLRLTLCVGSLPPAAGYGAIQRIHSGVQGMPRRVHPEGAMSHGKPIGQDFAVGHAGPGKYIRRSSDYPGCEA